MFLKSSLWNAMNSRFGIVRYFAEKLWNVQQAEYGKYLHALSTLIPDSQMTIIRESANFHDCHIVSLQVIHNETQYKCVVNVLDGVHKSIIFNGIRAMEMNIDSFESCVMGQLSWGYCEFQRMESTWLVHLIFDTSNNLSLICENFSIL